MTDGEEPRYASVRVDRDVWARLIRVRDALAERGTAGLPVELHAAIEKSLRDRAGRAKSISHSVVVEAGLRAFEKALGIDSP